MQILNGKQVSAHVKSSLKERLLRFQKDYNRLPGLAVIRVGDDPASEVYVRNKIKACDEVGIRSFHHHLPANVDAETVRQLIRELNINPGVDGILLQLPLPDHLNKDELIECIDPLKDPDGLTQGNLGSLVAGRTRVAPCTPSGVIEMLKFYSIPIAGQRVVVVGRSQIVGKPMALLLLEENATVTIAHSKTSDLESVTREADIVVVAAGRPHLLGKSAFKKDAVVIDVGIHRGDEGLRGDVRFHELEGHVRAASPVPGGVGPMTIAMLLKNTVQLAEKRAQREPPHDVLT